MYGLTNCQGTITYNITKKNCEKYLAEKQVGEFRNGYLHGQGTVYFLGVIKSKFVGLFIEGRYWNGTEYDENGNILRKKVNGKNVD